MDLARELKDDEALEHDASLEIIAALDVGEMRDLETALSLELGDEFDADEGATAEDKTCDAPVDGKARRSLAHVATSPVGLAAWTVAFTAFYAKAEFGGSWAKGFYYTVQAGLSVGFGVLPERGNRLSLIVTTVNVFLGAGVIAQCLASYAGRLCDLRDEWHAEVVLEKELARSGEVGERLERRVALAKDMIRALRAADAAAAAPPPRRRRSFAALAPPARVAGRAPSRLGNAAKIARLERIVRRTKLRLRRTARARLRVWLRLHSDDARAWALLATWLLLGTAYGLVFERWSGTRSFYFAVCALSTAGLQGIDPDSEAWQFLLVGAWLLAGVPIFAHGVGTVARLLLRESSDAEVRARSWGNFGEGDWDDTVALLSEYVAVAPGRISREQFILSELLRSGSVSGDLVDIILDKFSRFDTDGDATLTKAEYVAFGSSVAAKPGARAG